MEFVTLLILSLAVYRVTHLLVYERGPYALLERLRDWVAFRSEVLDCHYCTSIWVAGAVVVLYHLNLPMFVWLILAASAVSTLLHQYTER